MEHEIEMFDYDVRVRRMEELLLVAREFIQKRYESIYVLDLGEIVVNYDGTECDEYCLKSDIEGILDIDDDFEYKEKLNEV